MKIFPIIFLIISNAALGQNLVPPFTATDCPQTWVIWSDSFPVPGFKGLETPDFYCDSTQVCNNSYSCLPWAWCGTQPGSDYAGIIGYPAQEGIAGRLAVQASGICHVGLSAIRGDSAGSDYYVEGLKIVFDGDTLFTPRVWEKGMTWMRWDTVVFLQPTDSIRILPAGNPAIDFTSSNGFFAYYFIDSIVVEMQPLHYWQSDQEAIEEMAKWEYLNSWNQLDIYRSGRKRKKTIRY